jgi:predicted regulator of Ras-like GTPase activity (Roadblock/LC7/MglB family)
MREVWVGLNAIADEIREISDVMAFALVRRDGTIVTHGLMSSADPKVVAAMTAAISGTAELATEQLRQGRFLRTIVECEHGKILITDAGRQALLVFLVFSDANLGLVLMQLEKVGRKIADMLDRNLSPHGGSGVDEETLFVDRME